MTPPERTVGLGIAHPRAELDVPCGLCHAVEGEPCVSPRKLIKDGFHAVRVDRAHNRHRGRAYRKFLQLENEALRRDPNGPLWSFQSIAHQCGVLGPHVASECRPPTDGAE